MKAEELKYIVKEKYTEIANNSLIENNSGCCGTSSCCGDLEISMIGDEYDHVDGHIADADLGLGCGIPTQFANLKEGDVVLDLGSGAGNDCFVARKVVGDSGEVVGLDFTDAMITKARRNNEKLGFQNVSFVKGDIEEMPLDDHRFDVILSNCVLNLVPDKQKAFAEIYRVLKSGGHFCVSDVVLKGDLPEALKKDAEMYAGCVSGASRIDDYLKIITDAGFKDVLIHKEKIISIPQHLIDQYLKPYETFNPVGNGIFSITVSAYK